MKTEVIQFLSIIPFGLIQKKVLNFLQFRLANIVGSQVRIFNAQPIPQYAFDPKRNQYHSTRILESLKQIKARGELILGIVDVDLYAPELNFVFGEANILDSVCIISIMRLRQEYYGLPKNNKLFLERILKEAIHEIGHTYGLAHCDNPKCIMHFSNSLKDTDTKGPGFCFRCNMKIK
ncbi:MAG: archaemetzincin family Zn-dependent metalloprotease [Candidatus Jettenia caeni]|nr:MAG: archaemetzincin family Zn-dependent metalloprotease [Candidatus Jettenia caeni]